MTMRSLAAGPSRSLAARASSISECTARGRVEIWIVGAVPLVVGASDHEAVSHELVQQGLVVTRRVPRQGAVVTNAAEAGSPCHDRKAAGAVHPRGPRSCRLPRLVLLRRRTSRSGTHRPIDAGPGTALAQPDPNEAACVACGQRIRHVPEIAAPPQFVCAGSSAHRPAVTTRPQDPRSPRRTRARARARISRNRYSEDDDEDRSESWLSHAQSTAGNAGDLQSVAWNASAAGW